MTVEPVKPIAMHSEEAFLSAVAPPLPSVPSFADIEAQLAEFERAERERLGLVEEPVIHWVDENPQTFTRAERGDTTILIGGLTLAHDQLVHAAWEGLGYKVQCLDVPDTAALHRGKEFGNRGQCNPTYFTVGNLVKHLQHLRDRGGLSPQEIVDRYVFLTAGACGPCRFGTYTTEYRKALRDSGFEGFRVMLFQQQGGLKQATGDDDGAGAGLEMNPTFFMSLLKAIIAGDVVNAVGYRIRPYEVEPGATDRALEACKAVLAEALRQRRSVLVALWRCRRLLNAVEVDRLQPKPKVMVIGEFWAMTTEGDGNYRLQRFLEEEGAEVEVQMVSAWLLYNLWQLLHDTKRRMDLRVEDTARYGLSGVDIPKRLVSLWAAEKAVRGAVHTFAAALGLTGLHLPDMDAMAEVAHDLYKVELRGGEGHMEVGKLIQAVQGQKAHMVVSVKPFGCMPSSAVSDGVQSLVLRRYPEAIFCPIETSGDGAVNFYSRIQMFLFKARRKARAELDAALAEKGLDLATAHRRVPRKWRKALHYPAHQVAGTGANLVMAL